MSRFFRALEQTPGASLFILLLALLAHGLALGGDFVWLDHAHIEHGLALRPLSQVGRLFTEGFAGTGYFRPLVAVSLSLAAALQKLIFGVQGPQIYHLTTLLWHVSACILLRQLALELRCTTWAALGAACVFAVHPASTLVAELIAFHSESMTLCGLLLLLLGLLRSNTKNAVLGVLLAGLSKETGLALTPLLLLSSVCFIRSFTLNKKQLVVVIAVWSTVLFLRALYAPEWRSQPPMLDLDESLGTRFSALAKTARHLLGFTPLRSVCDDLAIRNLISVDSLLGIFVGGTLVVVAWQRRGAWIWSIFSLLPVLQIVPVARFWSPHYAYIPLAFLLLASAGDISKNTALAVLSQSRKVWSLAVMIIMALVIGLGSSRFNDEPLLWMSEVSDSPRCREAHFFLAEQLRLAGRFEEAQASYTQALRESRRSISYLDEQAAHANLGVVYLELKQPTLARKHFTRALEYPEALAQRTQITHNLALAALLSADPATTIRLLSPGIESAVPESQRIYAAAIQLQAITTKEKESAGGEVRP